MSTHLVQFFVAVLYQSSTQLSKIQVDLEKIWGPVDAASKTFPFNLTDYYTPEMGGGLQRKFLTFEKLMSPCGLTEIKERTTAIENRWRVNDKRVVNLDPGYLDSHKIVLASHKFGGHKIAIAPGVYADMVLRYQRGSYQPFDWTFPDFRLEDYHLFFTKVRASYLKKLASLPALSAL